MTNDHSVRSPSTDGGGMRGALESARLDFHNGLDKLDRAIDKIQSSDGGVEGHAGTRPTVIACDTGVEKAATVAPEYGVGIKPGPSEANSPAAPVAWLREWSFEGEEKIQICDSFERGAYPVYRAGVREAVAWRVKNDFGHWYITQDKALADTYRDIEKLNVEPLYGSPVDAGVREVDYTTRRFNDVRAKLQAWRDADHEDSIALPRSYVCELLDGIAALQQKTGISA